MTKTATALTIALLMCVASVGGLAARPNATALNKGTGIVLEVDIPKTFGEWTEVPVQTVQLVNPQQKEILDKIYSQLLSRIYVNKSGYRIMLAMAYGDDQRGGLQAHRPEVCYPSSGFVLGKVQDGTLSTSFGNIDVRRLETHFGARNEPVTYWLTVGDQTVQTRMQRRIAEVRLGLTGQIPDGLLFRVSSIDTDNARGFAMQQKFTADLMSTVPPAIRKQLGGAGLVAPVTDHAPASTAG